MDTEGLFSLLSDIQPVSKGFRKALEKEMIFITRPKHHILLESPMVAGFIYFLNAGFATAYAFVDGKKVTEVFWKPGQLMISSNSFFEQIPSEQSIQLMEKSDLWCVSHDRLLKLFKEFPEAAHICRVLMSRQEVQSRSRISDLQRLTSSALLQKLLGEFPDLEQLVSQEAIATYLGITPQSLSRMKRDLTYDKMNPEPPG